VIICPNCQYKEMSGAIYCSQCGAQLVEMTFATQKMPETYGMPQALPQHNPVQPEEPAGIRQKISLNLMESGQILPLADRSEFTLGRSTKDQPIVPDVDLTQNNAYASGVSRLHAVLKTIQKETVIMDLGSSNGTYLNGNRLAPYIVTPVTHGDVIHLGRLKIQLLIE
jgi:hypothetical protein